MRQSVCFRTGSTPGSGLSRHPGDVRGSMILRPSTFVETAMRHILTCVTVLAVLATRAPAQDQPIPLFNGKDLSGSTPVLDQAGADPARTWSVADGVLKCTGKPAGYIKTDREFGDYLLTLQWRWPEGTAGGNNGVLVHASTPRALGIWPKSIEVQLFKGNAGDLWVIGT